MSGYGEIVFEKRQAKFPAIYDLPARYVLTPGIMQLKHTCNIERFSGFMFVLVACEANVKKVYKLVNKKWGLGKTSESNLVIIVLGSAKKQNYDEVLTKEFIEVRLNI